MIYSGQKIVVLLCIEYMCLQSVCFSAGLSFNESTGEVNTGSGLLGQVILTVSSTERVSAMQFDIEYSASLVEMTSINAGDAVISAQKQLSYNRIQPGKVRIVIVGLNQNIIPSGVIAEVQWTVCKSAFAANTEIKITNPVLSTPQGTQVPVTTSNWSLIIFRDSYHTADENKDWKISLDELLRVIQFYNSGGIYCDCLSEDGYSPSTLYSRECLPHSSDYYNGHDWRINLYELLRLVQIYNYGKYHPDPSSEDGFGLG